jgi:hypothetical protein
VIFGKPKYFHLATNYLQYNRGLLEHFLDIKQVAPEDYLRAYDYFTEHPTKYDGATIVKDLDDVFGLDLSALCHDYDYIVRLKRYKGLKWLKMKFKYDWEYGKRMEEMGKSILTAYLRVFGLIITTPIYLLWYGKL